MVHYICAEGIKALRDLDWEACLRFYLEKFA